MYKPWTAYKKTLGLYMSKKSHNKNHIQNQKFKDRNLSSIDSHPKEKSKLRSPFAVLKNLQYARPWVDDCLPNILWACILAATMERGVYLRLFRQTVSKTRESLSAAADLHVTHNFIATASEHEFDTMFQDVLSNEIARHNLAALLHVKCLPDYEHWQRHLVDITPEEGYKILALAIGEAFDHQSQIATDVRWLKVMSQIIIRQNFFFPPNMEEKIKEFRFYPDYGNMQQVRPAIRALEVSLRETEFPTDSTGKTQVNLARPLPELHSEQFWCEMRAKTHCFPYDQAVQPKVGDASVVEEIMDILQALDLHFHSTEVTTGIDPRHEGAFGIVGYALHLLLHVASTPSHSRVEGRNILRTIVETFITFSYLVMKDDDTMWLQYRSAGAGQIKLVFLKNIREESAPDFLDLELMEALANEDRWMELQDIPLGHWASLNLRKIAEEANVKDVYDRYYDWCSNYTHGQWGAVRDAALTTCLNPLHRFHRMPSFMKNNMPSVLPDGCKILNRMLDDLNKLYPTFKPRIKSHKIAR